MSGNLLSYDSSPSDDEVGFYETFPPNSAPPTNGSSTGGHYIKSNASGLTGISRGDKLPCTDCHEPHNTEPTNEVFLRGSSEFPLGGKIVTNLKASSNTRSGTGNGREICAVCHAYSDSGAPVRFVDVNPDYSSTDYIVQTPSGIAQHLSNSTESCTDCHKHNKLTCGDVSGSCHNPPEIGSHDTHTTAAKGPSMTSCTGASGCHKGDHSGNFNDNLPLSSTTSCDNCHSPDGIFNGVTLAKANWDEGVYDGTNLKSGLEFWCASCHDDEPAYSKAEKSEVIVDNTEASFTGSWATSSHTTDYGSNYRYNSAGTGSDTATWTPNLPATGNYSVYAWWPVYTSNRATDAPFTVYYSGGSETVRVNQRMSGGGWRYLGTWNFSAGTSGYVILSDDADGTVMADAVRFVKGGNATYAPNIVGDNTTYGFYATGHGRNGVVDCLSCHDSDKTHIDGIHRTYEADESTSEAINQYNSSYRLKDPDNLPAMVMPRKTTSSSNMQAYWQDFNLCFDCHNRYEVLGETYSDVSNTNFWNDDSSISNSHWLHLGIDSKHFDSDYDSAADSRESCIACHNVHGSPTGPMIRHGELISYPETSNKVPAHNFYYLLPGDGSATAKFTPTLAGGTYNVYAWWSSHSNRATNAKYIIYHDGGSAEAIVNQEVNGSQWNLLGEFNITTSNGTVVLTSDGANEYIMADGIQWNRTDGGDTVYIDEPDATYTETWTLGTSNPDKYYGDSTRYYYAPIKDATASVNETIGGIFYVSGAITANHLCQMCHSNVQYLRDPYTGPRIPYGNATPDNISNFESNAVTLTAFVTDVDDDVASVTIDLSRIGGSNNQEMYDDGSNGDTTPGDGTYSYLYTVPAGVDNGPVTLTVTATDDDGNSCEGLIELTVYQPGALVIDDEDATYTGTWGESAADETTYGTGYHWHASGTGSNTAEWSFNITAAGSYTVYAWWVTGSNRATDAPYTIYYEGGSETVRVSQKIKGGEWNRLGRYYFGVGEYSVVLSDDADNYVIADAIKIESEAPPTYYPWPIADNPDAEYNGTGWGAGTGDTGYYGTDFYYHASGTGENTANWTLTVPEVGTYDVYAWWAEGSNRATDAPYTIYYEGGSETVRVSQKINGGKWNLLGTYPFNAGNYSVILSDDANGYIIADAVKFELNKSSTTWLTPAAIQCTNLSNASALIDEDTATANLLDTGYEQYVVFDLGSNYTVPSIKMYTDGSGSYTWDVFMGNDTSISSCCNHSSWGTLVLDDWTPTGSGWNETNLTTVTMARYIKLVRDDTGTDLAADSLYEFMFDPPDATLTFELHSYADMHIYDPESRHVGINYTTGEIENQIPGAICSFRDIQRIILPKLAVGEYKVILKGTGTGNYELVVTGQSEDGIVINQTFEGSITEGEIHDAKTEVNTSDASNISISLEDAPEPVIKKGEGVGKVTIPKLCPSIDDVIVDQLDINSINTSKMPDVRIHSAYMVNSSGNGEYSLRFENIENAETIIAVYKIDNEGNWIKLQAEINGSTVDVTMEAGDPPVVFVTSPETTETDTEGTTTKTRSGGGGGGGTILFDFNQDKNPSTTDEKATSIIVPQSNQITKPELKQETQVENAETSVDIKTEQSEEQSEKEKKYMLEDITLILAILAALVIFRMRGVV